MLFFVLQASVDLLATQTPHFLLLHPEYTYDVLVEDVLTFKVPESKLVEWKKKQVCINMWNVNYLAEVQVHIEGDLAH